MYQDPQFASTLPLALYFYYINIRHTPVLSALAARQCWQVGTCTHMQGRSQIVMRLQSPPARPQLRTVLLLLIKASEFRRSSALSSAFLTFHGCRFTLVNLGMPDRLCCAAQHEQCHFYISRAKQYYTRRSAVLALFSASRPALPQLAGSQPRSWVGFCCTARSFFSTLDVCILVLAYFGISTARNQKELSNRIIKELYSLNSAVLNLCSSKQSLKWE